VIPRDIKANELVMSHVSANFDRTDYQQDWNIMFPLDRVNELKEQGIIGSVADYHYSFMGAHDPGFMEEKSRDVAKLLLKDKVDAAFQTRVLHASLKLLEATSGPIIQNYEEDAPVSDGEITTLACPVTFPGKDVELSQTDKLVEAFKNEITGLRPWYDIAVENRGRTTVAASGMSPEEIGGFISTLIAGKTSDNPQKNMAIAYSVNHAIDDLRAYYSEAITAQPGQESPSSKVINQWFWTETVASQAIYALRDMCQASDDGMLKLVATVMLIPGEYSQSKY